MNRSVAVWAALVFLSLASISGQTLIPLSANWQFRKGTNEVSSPSSAWRDRTFDSSSWPGRPAPFAYGEPAFTGGTPLDDMQGSYTTVLLRREFAVTDVKAIAALTLNAVCDDGFIAWINGTQVAALNPPAGDVRFNSVAGGNVAEPIALTPYECPIPLTYLVNGKNVIAVQVFNQDIGSSDLVFDAELAATPTSGPPLSITAVSPAPGVVNALTQATVTFSEPVSGVRAEDFLLNGLMATAVTGSGTTYTFSFAQPAYGPVVVSWSVFHSIQSVAAPIRRFDASTPGSTWNYELVDASGPKLAQIHPPAELTVGVLRQVEIFFDRPVLGVDAPDLLVNGQPATTVEGIGAGPYLFSFAEPPAGVVIVSWANGHGITDDTPEQRQFGGGSWRYLRDPEVKLPDVFINEILAENFTGLKDEEGDVESWIELYNRSSDTVNLLGWSLTDDADEPGKWTFPSVNIPASGYLLVFASAKDRRAPAGAARFHTNFKLSPNGEYLGLFSPELPRRVVSELSPSYPEQGPDHSYGRDPFNRWRYYRPPTPGAPNGFGTITGKVDEVHFSVERGYYNAPFNLSLACPTPGARVVFTTNGSPPMETNGVLYTAPISVGATRIIRAAAFKTNHLPSRVRTHTYLFNIPLSRTYFPALSLVTASNNLYGATGIMEYSPRNTVKHGIAWERPVSAELIRPEANEGFQVDCGIRVAGGDYIRGLYNYRSGSWPQGKYSFRLYFRGDYGTGKLRYPWFPDTTLDAFDSVQIRAGMNDHTNPFIKDEFVRLLESDVGIAASHGTFVHLFLNGQYKGYYNPCERVDNDFLRAYHGGGEKWDVIAQMNTVREGDLTAFNALRTAARKDLKLPANYLDVASRLDLVNFIDYLCPLIYVDNDDWPHNNWRAARERVAGSKFRFYAWDSEWAFGHSPSWNTIANQLSTLSPPWGTTEIQQLFNSLKVTPEFKLLFADRVHKHFFNGGALTDERLKVRYEEIRARVQKSISGFDNRIGAVWIPQRRRYLTNHFASSGFIASSNAPVFSQFGGRIPGGYALAMRAPAGTVWFTTNGVDPRVMFTGAVHSDAVTADAPLTLAVDTLVKARTLLGTNWSALTEASFQVAQLGIPLRITEIMYRPPGGEEYEFLEIQNIGGVAVALDAITVSGVDFRFPVGTAPIEAGQRIVLASSADPAKFATRYPGVKVAGYFKGSLANNGERIALLDPAGRLISSVTYDNNEGWPIRADGTGASLEIVSATGDSDDPANWQASTMSGGSPGRANSPAPAAPVARLNEIYASGDGTAESDWIEIHNSASVAANVSGWSVTDDGDPRKFVFPAGSVIPASGFLRVWCDALSTPAGLHTGFGLRSEGETLQLFDNVGMLVDVVRFGPQAAGYTLGRAGTDAAWQLCDPTPEAPNEPAAVGDASTLVINEVMANPPSGSDDWIELHNPNATLPAPLQGIYLGASNALFQVRSLSFVAPGGFVKLIADENSGPNHAGFKLQARGDAVTLLDPTGAQLDRVTFTAQAEGTSYGRLPDGLGGFVTFQFTASPGASNYITFLPAVRLTEFMARNSGAVHDGAGRTPDWIELQNTLTTSIDLGGWSLSVGRREPGEWVFPSGVVLEPGAFLRIWCDAGQPASTLNGANLNTGRSLSGDGGGIHLFDPQERLVNFVEYGFQLDNQSVGWIDGSWALLTAPTPGTSNAPSALLGDASRVRLNEWLADPAEGGDWLELYNPESLPVNLHQHYLTDDPSVYGITNFIVGPLTFVPPRGFVLWRADGNIESGREHTPFNLDALGETVRLYGPTRALIDSADLLVQEPGVSEGRLPDGGTSRVRFTATASPRASNWLPIEGVIVSEVLTHTDPPLEDAIELFNPSDQPVVLSGGWLSNDETDLKKFLVPDGAVLPARGFKVFYQFEFDVDPLRKFTLNSAHGDAVFFSAVDAEGNLTGYRAQARFGAAENGVSFGFYPTSAGADFTALARRTFGADQPVSLTQFRTGAGLPNAGAKVGPVVINEIMYRPLTVTGTNVTEDAAHEFIELHNFTDAEVSLYDPAHPTNRWKLQGGVDYVFRPDTKFPPRSFMLVVGFDPETNSAALADFKARYPSATAGVSIVGPFSGRLSNEGESVELYKPDRPQQPPAPDAGFVPFILVDRVNYSAESPWPAATNSPNDSLQRMAPLLYGNEPLAWIAQSATAGAANGNFANIDTDGDGMPDVWELTYGLNPRSGADAAWDTDGDGMSNRSEFIAGTDPRDGGAAFAIVSVTRLGDEVVIKLARVAGRTYTVLYTDSLTAPWKKLQDVSVLPAGTDVFSVLDQNAAGAARFYRMVTPAQP